MNIVPPGLKVLRWRHWLEILKCLWLGRSMESATTASAAGKSLFMALLKYHFGVFPLGSPTGPSLALAPQLKEMVRHMDRVVVSFHHEVTTTCGSSNDNHIFSCP